eukprot:COSAG02_NODE_1021_length_15159_cov_24.514739_5_plen_163_part_00
MHRERAGWESMSLSGDDTARWLRYIHRCRCRSAPHQVRTQHAQPPVSGRHCTHGQRIQTTIDRTRSRPPGRARARAHTRHVLHTRGRSDNGHLAIRTYTVPWHNSSTSMCLVSPSQGGVNVNGMPCPIWALLHELPVLTEIECSFMGTFLTFDPGPLAPYPT